MMYKTQYPSTTKSHTSSLYQSETPKSYTANNNKQQYQKSHGFQKNKHQSPEFQAQPFYASQAKSVKCKYCGKVATGINYRPRPQLDNAPCCPLHTTSLYIPFAHQFTPDRKYSRFSQPISSQSPSNPQSYSVQPQPQPLPELPCSRQLNNIQFFQQMMSTIVNQFNLFKWQVACIEGKIKEIIPEDCYQFDLGCRTTNPYMILREDKEMMMNCFIDRVKKRFLRDGYAKKGNRYAGDDDTVEHVMYKSIITETTHQNQSTIIGSASGTPNNGSNGSKKQPRFFRKSDGIKQ